jgi:SAM-dependent methyltransferase
VVDLGCGLGAEDGYLSDRGWLAIGVDLSTVALRLAMKRSGRAAFVQADVLGLPIANRRLDLLLDRGCLHYLGTAGRTRYVTEARRVLRPGGRLLLRACLNTAGVRNDITEDVVRRLFIGWQIDSLSEETLSSDTRRMPALVARLVTP